jgi:transposase
VLQCDASSQVVRPPSTLAQWVGNCGVELQPLVDALKCDILRRSVLHADEPPVQMLKPGKGKSHRACLWASAAGTHARRKFHDLQLANQSQIAEQAVRQIAQIYGVEREVKDLNAEERLRIRQDKSLPLVQTLHDWPMLNRQKVPEGSATAKAIDYSLRRWKTLKRFQLDGQLPVNSNWVENQIRPIAIGRNNWLFAGSLRAGQRPTAVMSLIQSAKLNGHDSHVHLKDVLTRLPMHMISRLEELLPHCWTPI